MRQNAVNAIQVYLDAYDLLKQKIAGGEDPLDDLPLENARTVMLGLDPTDQEIEMACGDDDEHYALVLQIKMLAHL